jgi:exonuclease III
MINNMKYLTFIKNKFSQQKPTILLGRWNIVYCDKQINRKIDLSNEDHCGTCNSISNYNKYKDIKKMIFYECM